MLSSLAAATGGFESETLLHIEALLSAPVLSCVAAQLVSTVLHQSLLLLQQEVLKATLC